MLVSGEIAYQLSVQYSVNHRSSDESALKSRISSHFCGGALIKMEKDSIWAVTAAHCMMSQ